MFNLIGFFLSLVVILIISFGNIQAQCVYITVFFTELPATLNPTFIILGISLLGMVCGGFLVAFLSSLGKGDDEEYDDF